MIKSISAEIDQNKRYAKYKAFDKRKIYILKAYNIIKRLNRKYNFQKSLEVGCADGSFSEKLIADFQITAYGLDISKKAIISANKKGVRAKVHNLEKSFPFPSNYFDLIIACEIIEHLYDTDFFISEMNRVLTKNGILVITTPNLLSALNRIKIVFGKYPSFVPEYRIGGAGHIRAYSLSKLIQQIKEHNLNVISFYSPNIIFPMHSQNIPFIFKKVAMRLGDFFPKIGSHVIVVARKE